MALLVIALPSAAGADPTLIGQWHFDEQGGNVAMDSSGNGYDGTITGAATSVPGHTGAALSFDGGTALVKVTDSPLLQPTSAVTVSAWVKHAGSPGDYRYILAKGENGCVNASYGLYTGPSGGLAFYISNGRGNSFTRSPDAGMAPWDGAWHLVVGTFDGTAVHLFLDGTEVGTGTPRSGPIGYALSDSDDLFIGGYPVAGGYVGCHAGGFLGVIDEVALWNRALAPSEISAMMATGGVGAGPPPPPPTGSPPGSGPPPDPGAGPGSPPQIRGLKVSPSAAPSTMHGRRLSLSRSSVATISYVGTQAAGSTFIVAVARPGVVQAGRCVRLLRGAGRHPRRCTRLVAIARFTHTGHAGSNRVRFPVLVWKKLVPNRYQLRATPNAHGRTGATAVTSFRIVG